MYQKTCMEKKQWHTWYILHVFLILGFIFLCLGNEFMLFQLVDGGCCIHYETTLGAMIWCQGR